MPERVKTIAVLLFLAIAGLIGYQVYSGDFESFVPSPTAEPSSEPVTPGATPTPQVTIIESPSAVPTPGSVDPLPDPFQSALLEAGIGNPRIEELREDKEIFAIRIDALSDNVRKKEISSEGTSLGVLYQVSPTTGYEFVKSAILDRMASSPVWSMNETNSFGQASFYLNNRNRSDTVFVLIRFPSGVLGFEYPKANHGTFEKLFAVLGE